MGGSLFVLRVFCLCVSFCLLCLLFYRIRWSLCQRAEKHERRREENQSRARTEGKHLLACQPLEDGEDQQYPVRLYRNALGYI